MANHGVVNGTHCAFWDVDALNLVGICAGADIDNGNFVTLGDINKVESGAAEDALKGYEFAVTSASTTSSDYIVATPPLGYDLDAAIYNDPRYFFNAKGKPMSVKRLLVGDCIEVSEACFSTAPTAGTSTHAAVAAGKLVAGTTSSDPFKILGYRLIDIGQEQIKMWILMKLK